MDIQQVNHVLRKAIIGLQESEIEGFHSRMYEGARWDGVYVTPHARLRWSDYHWKLEELPVKGKKKLRVGTLRNPAWNNFHAYHEYLPSNVHQWARFGRRDSYDQIKKKLQSGMETATKKALERTAETTKGKGLYPVPWSEELVHYLKIVPEGTDPIDGKGKDFLVKSEWTKFSAYSPDSEFGHDPSYTLYESKSAAAARKLYKILKADPGALRGVPWGRFGDWLKRKKIAYKTHHSVWR
jgi:hypothetical protein